MIRIGFLVSIITFIAISFIANAQDKHSNHEIHPHAIAEKKPAILPIEAGQSAFAAIAEIVALLEEDPNTDWSTVNIDALREHLIDMNLLTLNSQVSKKVAADKVSFTITGSKSTVRAIQAMVPAHAKQLSLITPWNVGAQLKENGVVLTITSQDVNEIEKVSHLGFFGIMATDAHHQEHHLAMALGKMQR
jgi:hypothetical protein